MMDFHSHGKLKEWYLGTVVFFLVAGLSVPVFSQPSAQKMAGWERGSGYNRLYNAAETDRIKAVVESVEEKVPMPGMDPATVLTVKGSDGDKTTVHVCPAAFISPKDTGLKKGDEVKIRGAWAEVDGEDVFMASKIKKGDFFELKVRLTRDGTPFWTLSAEEIAKEKDSD